LSEVFDTLISLLLPEGILDYFELTKVDKDTGGLHIYLQEKDISPEGYDRKALGSKGFLPEFVVQDFSIRGKKAFCISNAAAGGLFHLALSYSTTYAALTSKSTACCSRGNQEG
jgi:hypothetical protein